MKDFDLEKWNKIGTGFNAPDRYFDDFPDRLSLRMQKEIGPRKSIYRFWHYAAAAVFVIGIGIPAYRSYTAEEAPQSADIESYFADHPVSEETLTELLDESDISRISSGIAPDDQAIEEMYSDNPNLEQYLTD